MLAHFRMHAHCQHLQQLPAITGKEQRLLPSLRDSYFSEEPTRAARSSKNIVLAFHGHPHGVPYHGDSTLYNVATSLWLVIMIIKKGTLPRATGPIPTVLA